MHKIQIFIVSRNITRAASSFFSFYDFVFFVPSLSHVQSTVYIEKNPNTVALNKNEYVKRGWGGWSWSTNKKLYKQSVVKENKSTVKDEKTIGHTDIKISVSLLFL